MKANEPKPNPSAVFNSVDYIRRLKQASVEVQRIRTNTTPQGVNAMKEAMQMLAGLVSHGMVQAKSVTPKADRDEFVDQMRKIIASSGTPAGKLLAADAVPSSAPGISVTTGVNEMMFNDRLPRFMKKWEEGDPEWRLLKCAIRVADDQTFVIGMAETSLQHYSVFHGVSGGEYKTREMSLLDAQNMLTAAYQRGYTAVSVSTLASTVSPTKVAARQYSVVRMTNAGAAVAVRSSDPSSRQR